MLAQLAVNDLGPACFQSGVISGSIAIAGTERQGIDDTLDTGDFTGQGMFLVNRQAWIDQTQIPTGQSF